MTIGDIITIDTKTIISSQVINRYISIWTIMSITWTIISIHTIITIITIITTTINSMKNIISTSPVPISVAILVLISNPSSSAHTHQLGI